MGLGTSSAYPRSRMPAPPQNKTTFMVYPLLIDLVNGHFGNRHHETSAPLANVLQLLHDFVFQIPRENHHVVGSGFADAVGMMDRNVRPRQESSLLVRAAIHGVFDQVFPNAAIMEKGRALA